MKKWPIGISICVASACGNKHEREGTPSPKLMTVADAAASPGPDAAAVATPPAPIVVNAGKGDCRTSYAPQPSRDPNPMCKIDGGEFTMGTPEKELPERTRFTLAETPAHRVVLSAYHLDQLEVTVAQVAFWLNATNSDNQCHSLFDGLCVAVGPSAGTSPIERKDRTYVMARGSERLPFTYFTFEGAKAYCEWAGKRLPTEAEWEFAARHDPVTGKDLVYPWGNTFEPKRANCDERDCADGYEREAPVGSLADVSPWGVEDMAGNVGEYVADCWDWHLETCKGVCRDPKGIGRMCMERVTRSGNWSAPRVQMRAASRGPANKVGLGVRCAR